MNREISCNVCCGAGGIIYALALVAWLGVPAAIAALSFVGLQLGSLNPVLAPVIVVALGLVSIGLWLGTKSHGHGEPFMVGLVGSAATVVGLLAAPAVATLGFFIVAGSIAWNQLFLHRKWQHTQPQ